MSLIQKTFVIQAKLSRTFQNAEIFAVLHPFHKYQVIGVIRCKGGRILKKTSQRNHHQRSFMMNFDVSPSLFMPCYQKYFTYCFWFPCNFLMSFLEHNKNRDKEVQ